MPSQVFNRHYWSAQELVVLGVFSAACQAFHPAGRAGGGRDEPGEPARQEPHFHHAARGHALQGAQAGDIGPVCPCEHAHQHASAWRQRDASSGHAAGGGMRRGCDGLLRWMRAWRRAGVAVYDLTSKVFSLGVSWLFMRESPALLYVIVPIVVIGYVGSLCGLFSGVRAVRELRHAGIVRN